MAEELKKQIAIIEEQKQKVDKMKEEIVANFVIENMEVGSVLEYAEAVTNLQYLVDGVTNAYRYTISEPVKSTLLKLAKLTKLVATKRGIVIGKIPSSLTKQLKNLGSRGNVYSVPIEEYVYIGFHDREFTEFAITGGNALKFALKHFVVDWSVYKKHIESLVVSISKDKDERIKYFDNRINDLYKGLEELTKIEVSE